MLEECGLSVAFHASRGFVYTTNSNGPDASSVTAFQIDSAAFLTPVIGSPFPTNGFGATAGRIDPTGRYFFVSNTDSNSIQAFVIDQTTGALRRVPGSPFPTPPSPSTVLIDPSGKYLYCANTASSSVSAYLIDSDTGALTLIDSADAGVSPAFGELVSLQ